MSSPKNCFSNHCTVTKYMPTFNFQQNGIQTQPKRSVSIILDTCYLEYSRFPSFPVKHTRLFPRALGEMIERYNVQELHVTLTSGLWRYENWGYPVVDAAPGAEVWAWFKSGTEDVETNWKLLANSLSGLLCASLNFIDMSNSISPEFSFRPRGVNDNAAMNSSYVR